MIADYTPPKRELGARVHDSLEVTEVCWYCGCGGRAFIMSIFGERPLDPKGRDTH